MNGTHVGKDSAWLLPDAVEEVLPPAAAELEQLRQTTLKICATWGYEQVMPPAIEFLESLLSGVAHDLDLQTFKITDQMSGRMMGVRADITPQVARIDAHQLKSSGPTRLCYTGAVLRTRPDGLGGSRNPLQMGAELYGHSGIESDVEVIGLMVSVLQAAGAKNLQIDLGHVGIFRGLVANAGLDAAAETRLWDALQRKSAPDLANLLSELSLQNIECDRISALVGLNGGREVLDQAEQQLAGAGGSVQEALQSLIAIADLIARWLPSVTLHFDLGELRGYRYHTGVVFAAYVPDVSQELARGGRYDAIGAVFGRARAATGFSTDLKALLALSELKRVPPQAIAAPWQVDRHLWQRVMDLRNAGEIVIWMLPNDKTAPEALGCNRILTKTADEDWQVEPV